MKKTAYILLLILLIAPVWAVDSKASLLSVGGSGSVMVKPDTASVRLGVEVIRPSAQAAQSDNAKLMQTVIASIAKLGISSDKIQTSGFNIWPETKYSQTEPSKITGYRCANQVIVTVNDLALVSRVIDSGISAGVNNVAGIQFVKKDDNKDREEALKIAVSEASDKARAIAQSAGVKLKGIRTITEGGAALASPQYEAGLKSMAANFSETPVSAGLLEVRGSVTVVYEIE